MNLNWMVGWMLILAGFVSGAILGLFFHREEWLGGYGSFRRRILRLGHIACVALGILNILYAYGPNTGRLAAWCFAVGGVAMPTVCFLTAWKKSFRHSFFIPVLSLLTAVVLTIQGGLR